MKPRHIITLAALAPICWAMTSCTVTTPEGSATVDAPAAIAIAEILADK